jgi:transcription elongation factor Elf1
MVQLDAGGGVPEWHSFRCPVCGHADEVDLGAGPSGTVSCSHCGTALEIEAWARDEATATVKVATRRRRKR